MFNLITPKGGIIIEINYDKYNNNAAIMGIDP